MPARCYVKQETAQLSFAVAAQLAGCAEGLFGVASVQFTVAQKMFSLVYLRIADY